MNTPKSSYSTAFGVGGLNPVKLQRMFFLSVAIILFVTAVLKLHASVLPTTKDYLDRSDEIVGFLTHRQLLLLV